jgi:8-hydroxy-5-deazaflavin:NADPH oxidoreductase
MRIGVFGTGMAGRAIAEGLAGFGHQIVMGTRDPASTRGRSEPDMYGFVVGPWLEQHPELGLDTFAGAAKHGEIVINATNGLASLDAVTSAAGNLDGKVLIDVANALDFSKGMPPGLHASADESLAERIQQAVPGARVVKSLNTVASNIMLRPGDIAGGDHTVFVSGNDAPAKATVVDLLRSVGWRDIVDLGGLETARATELLMPMWVTLMGLYGLPPRYQFKIVRS